MIYQTEIYEWLTYHLESGNVDQIKEALKNEKASSFLIVWSLFEQRIFGGSMQERQIPAWVDNHAQHLDIAIYEDAVKHFHDRYKDEGKLRNLANQGSFALIHDLINVEYSALTDDQKFTVLIYVIYRFRNNIFHGNKGLESWVHYTTEIDLCIYSMMRIMDQLEVSMRNQNVDNV